MQTRVHKMKLISLLVIIVTFVFVFGVTVISAESRLQTIAQKNDPNRPAGAAPVANIGAISDAVADEAADKFDSQIGELGDKILKDFEMALALANTLDSDGKKADPIAAPCLEKMVEAVKLVQANRGNADEGVVTKLVRVRILRLKLQSQDLRSACAAWKEDVRGLIRGVAGNILGLAFGAMKFGL